MALRIRRGTEAERLTISNVDAGELLWTTNTQKMYIGLGNGLTGNDGMVNIGAALAGDGLAWDDTTQTLKFGGVNYTTDDVAEGIMAGRQYFTDVRAQAATAAALAAGTHTHIAFVYDDQDDSISATVTLDGVGITSVQADTSPTLGGNLDLDGNDINGTGNIDITGNISNGLISFDGSTVISTETPLGGSDRTDAPLYIGNNTNPNTLWVTSDNNFGVLRGLTDGTNNAGLTFKVSRGTLASPTINLAGDGIAFMDALAYDGSQYVNVGAFGLFTDVAWDGTVGVGSSIPGAFGAVVINEFGDQQTLSFNSSGVLDVPTVQVGDGSAAHPSIRFLTDGSIDTGFFHPGDGIICVSTNGQEKVRVDSGGMRVVGFMKVGGFATGSLPSPAEAGMIALDTTTNQFKGYNGSAWVVLG